MSDRMNECRAVVTGATAMLFLLMPAVVLAHVGVGATQGFLQGLNHPLSGADHVLAMVAVGLWAAQRGGRFLWQIPLISVVVMAAAGLAAAFGLVIPFPEAGIVASLIGGGLLVAVAAEVPSVACLLIVGVFALFHGHAHGTEMPADAPGLLYGLGFLVATVALQVAGIGLGGRLTRVGRYGWVRAGGAGIALAGIVLAVVRVF